VLQANSGVTKSVGLTPLTMVPIFRYGFSAFLVRVSRALYGCLPI